MKRKLLAIIAFVYSGFAFNASAQTVALDYYFNHETRKDKNGQPERFHYLWEDTGNTGFSVWGGIFKAQGATLTSIDAAPTAENLKGVSAYIIVDPDSRKENPQPNYVTQADVANISKWVKQGGVLVLMANDSANVELPHFNLLADAFGLHFNNDIQNHVVDDAHFEDGGISTGNSPIFKTAKKPFMKDVCSIAISGKAQPMLKAANGTVIAACTKYGQGTVIAIGDPWLYNEYVNGRLPAQFDNDKAAADITAYILSLARKK
ncbi:DUF4350 domain-containing protein [Mucilaginibacter pedocola]|uniref:DUF4350 domain-containing protein n=1 Tax=Mucilaginibacter pedocola TaxID=1792845 RepID=A0A1S9P6E3_9SPHI|nr:DUF4350 domain-containing protein [Mucilaginibacter pedocola]OOQ56526.1 hypothetical protein BC343_18980 [Mucilaginibacter pedocola]